MTEPPDRYLNDVETCPHDQGFYNSGEGLSRCRLCGASYDYIRGKEAGEFKMSRTTLIEHARAFFGVRDNATIAVCALVLWIAVTRIILDWLHVTNRNLYDTLLSCVGMALALGIIFAFVWAKQTEKKI